MPATPKNMSGEPVRRFLLREWRVGEESVRPYAACASGGGRPVHELADRISCTGFTGPTIYYILLKNIFLEGK
jgi:hypothetical protein